MNFKNKLKFVILFVLFFSGVSVFYSNCSVKRGTETGNPMAPGADYLNPESGGVNKIPVGQSLAKYICLRVNECFHLESNACIQELIVQPQMTFELKVPQYANLKEIIASEVSKNLTPNIENAQICSQKIYATECGSDLWGTGLSKGSYEDIQTILRADVSCQGIF